MRLLTLLHLKLLKCYKWADRLKYYFFRLSALVTDLSTLFVVPLTKKVLTDDEGLGFDFGEEALETASTSKEGSRSENYSMTHRRSSDKN
jgi:hypothetical protein